MADPVEKQLYDAASSGRVSEVSSLLRDHPEINVNWADLMQWTPLHMASWYSHVEVVKLLLAHPNIDVNVKTDIGETPFLLSFQEGPVSVGQLLQRDLRVDVTLDDNDGRTPLWWASYSGKHEVIERLIASGRDLGDIGKKGIDWEVGEDYTALEIARKCRSADIVSLLERFLDNPAQTSHELRVKLGVLDPLAAELFAVVVFLCDDLLHLKPASHLAAIPDHAAAAATRFFAIASKLPLELQMMLCHRAVGSMKQNILLKYSEAAFKSLARIRLSLQ